MDTRVIIPPADVDDQISRWVGAGLVTPEQAEAIRRYELGLDRPAVTVRRLTVGSEVAAYLGGALALMGGVVVVGERWRDLSFPGRFGVALALVLVGFSVGTWLVRLDEPGTRRLGGFLWLLGTTGAALAVGVAADAWEVRSGYMALLIGGVVAAIGAELWSNTDMPVQMVTFVAGLGMMLGGGLDVTRWDVWLAGLVVWPVAVCWSVAATRGIIRPRLVAIVVGFGAAMLATAMLGDLDRHLGPAAAVATAALMVTFALVDRSTPLLVVGVFGFIIAVQALLATTFTGVASSGIVTVVGLTVVIVTIVRARRVS